MATIPDRETGNGTNEDSRADSERDGTGNQAIEGRRDFLKGAVAAGGAAASFAAAGLSSVTTAQAQPGVVPGTKNHYYVPATDKTVHWGYFSKLLKPLVEVELRRLRHDRDAHASRQRRRRAHGQGRSGRRERLLLGQDSARA